jgi:sarcosine oxidase
VIDVFVIGGGVFGLAVALELSQLGRQVQLISAAPPGQLGASAAETRIARLSYGDDVLMSRLALDGVREWQELQEKTGTALFHPTGVMNLITEHGDSSWEQDSRRTLAELGSCTDELDSARIRDLCPFMSVAGLSGALLERDGGILLARQATQALHQYARSQGVEMLTGRVRPTPDGARLGEEALRAHTVVWAPGAEVRKAFPQLGFIAPRTQDSYFFPEPRSHSSAALPAWIDRAAPAYGVPDVGTGMKIALDTDRNPDDPADVDEGERVQQYVRTRFPGVNVTSVRVEECTYAATPDEDFVVGQIPGTRRHWIVGGDSGHGFKHALSWGHHAARVIQGKEEPHPRHRLERFTQNSGGVG